MGIAILVPGADYSALNLGQVTIQGTIPVTGISIIGPIEVTQSGQFRASFSPAFATQRSVVWSIVSGSQYASINSSGVLVASEGASSSPVTIRCTSSVNSTIYDEKTVSVTAGDVILKNYIQGDGAGYFVLPGMELFGGTITLRGKHSTGANMYIMCSMSADSTGQKKTRISMHTNSSSANKIAGFNGTGSQATGSKQDIVYRYVWTLSSSDAAGDGKLVVYNDDTDAVIDDAGSSNVRLNGLIGIFTYMVGYPGTQPAVSGALGDGRFYSLLIEKDNEIIADYRACKYQNQIAIIDLVSEDVYYPTDGSGLTVG